MITVQSLKKVFSTPNGDVVALDGIDLEVGDGEIHGIVGPSGAGKSTLIRCLTALERPSSGTIVVDGVELTDLKAGDLRRHRRKIGMVFQSVDLFDSRTAIANIAYPLRIAGTARAEATARAADLLDIVGLAGRETAYPAELSGGQQQRVGIARALAAGPSVLLCDEPSSALDWGTTRQILELIKEVRDRIGVTVLIITHEMSVVRQVCDSVSQLAAGRIVQRGALSDVVTQFGTPLARDLIPLAATPVGNQRAQLEVSFSSEFTPVGEVLTRLARLGDGVDIEAGTVETLAGQRVGRFQLDVPAGERDAVAAALRQDGLHVEVAA